MPDYTGCPHDNRVLTIHHARMDQDFRQARTVREGILPEIPMDIDSAEKRTKIKACPHKVCHDRHEKVSLSDEGYKRGSSVCIVL